MIIAPLHMSMWENGTYCVSHPTAERWRSPAAGSGSEARADARGSQVPGRADGYPSGPPTDPHVRNSRMRFLRQSLSYPWILSRRGVVTRLVSAKSLSCIVPPGTLCPTSPSLPWVAWASLPQVQRYYATLRLPPVLLGVLRWSLVPRYLACFPRSWSPRRARGLVEAPSPRQGLWSPGPPLRACVQGHRWLSQVPESPLCRHAPLSDPGGVLRTRHSAPRTTAFQSLETVGFPPRYPFRGSITRPVSSLHPASYGPLRGGTRVRY